jgi:hypothetical protein
MKRTVLIVFAAFLMAGAVQAADFAVNPDPPMTSTGSPFVPDLPNITQSADPVNVVAGSVACVSGGISSDNYFLRRFFLNADHGITLQYNVTSVDYGIESVNVYIGTTAPITINTYSIANGAAFTFANMTQLDTVTRNFPDGTALVVENFVVAGSILNPATEDLVVAWYNPDVTATGDYGMWPGSNSAGETQPSYLASVGCGLNEPGTLASIGFPNMHLVMTVNGDEQVVPTPTNPPIQAGEPVPAMNRFGIIAMVVLLVGVAILVMWRRS